jgi:DivIVA domain-containing protein
MTDSNVRFRRVLHGYDPAQVNQHVNQLAQASAAVWQEAAERTLQVTRLEAANDQLKGEAKRHAQRARELEEAQVEAAAPSYEGLGERIISILTLADTEATELRARAQADAANQLALAEDNALATRLDADDYAMKTRSVNDDEVARILEEAKERADTLVYNAEHRAESLLEDAKQRADKILDDANLQEMSRQDADLQATARREEAEAAYERARASSAAAAVDFETTLAARRDTAASEFAAQLATAEQQLAAVRLRAEQIRNDYEQAQQEVATKSAQQLEQATAAAKTLVAEAKTKAELIRANSEREIASATERRDHINAQLSIVRRDLAALGGVTRFNPVRPAEPAADGTIATGVAGLVQQEVVANAPDDLASVLEDNPSETVSAKG